MYIIRQQWLQDNAIRKWYFLAAILILFGGCSTAILVSDAPQNQWLSQTIFSRFLVFSLLVPVQILLLLSTFRVRLQDIYVTGSRPIIWKQLEYRLAIALLVTYDGRDVSGGHRYKSYKGQVTNLWNNAVERYKKGVQVRIDSKRVANGWADGVWSPDTK